MSIPANLLKPVDNNISDEFRVNIMSKIRTDEIGQLCCDDPTIVLFGKRLYEKIKRKQDKENQVKNTVRLEMRRLGNLFLHYRTVRTEEGNQDTNVTCRDMLQRENFDSLETAITRCCAKSDDSNDKDLKAGLKLSYYYLLKKLAKVVKCQYLIEKEDAKANE